MKSVPYKGWKLSVTAQEMMNAQYRAQTWRNYREAYDYYDTRDEIKHQFFVYASLGSDRSHILDSGSSLHLAPRGALTREEFESLRKTEPI